MTDTVDTPKVEKVDGLVAPATETVVVVEPAGPKSDWKMEWDKRIAEFSAKTGKAVADIEAVLAKLVGVPSESALGFMSAISVEDPEAKVEMAVLKIPVFVLKECIGILRGPKPVLVSTLPATAGTPEQAGGALSTDILPSIPDDDSFLTLLKTGGELKIGKTEVIAATRAALANRVGLYELPDKIIDSMEKFAEGLDEPCPAAFYEIQKIISKRTYADILKALDIEGTIRMSQKRKDEFLSRIESGFWESIAAFHGQVKGWQEQWMSGAANPGMMMSMLAAAVAGGGAGMPPGMLSPPDTSGLRDEAEGVINIINRTFSGTGIPVARALAYDAQEIKKILTDDRLPSQIGAANREQMLKMLKTNVSADYVRLERNVTKYILSVMEYPNLPSGQTEIAYLAAMLQLGISIPWETLSGGQPTKGRSSVPKSVGPGLSYDGMNDPLSGVRNKRS